MDEKDLRLGMAPLHPHRDWLIIHLDDLWLTPHPYAFGLRVSLMTHLEPLICKLQTRTREAGFFKAKHGRTGNSHVGCTHHNPSRAADSRCSSCHSDMDL